ncbi:DUF2769 domain-containing protein [Methanosarcina horonobensis]|uniref:DUF2769 domain-containing protein n=1 Tax=Methanosarcina horonobensis TaxID=418008 RepID=UPI000B2DF9B7|nr:DUF2769 domain-containing protein [Methanosarcina horonobensis]
MFCARGGVIVGEGRKEDCLCERCELFKSSGLKATISVSLKKKRIFLKEARFLRISVQTFRQVPGK